MARGPWARPRPLAIRDAMPYSPAFPVPPPHRAAGCLPAGWLPATLRSRPARRARTARVLPRRLHRGGDARDTPLDSL